MDIDWHGCPAFFYFYFFILKRHTIRTFCLPFYTHSLTVASDGGSVQGKKIIIYRSITIILSYHPSSVCPNSLSLITVLQTAIVIAHTASKKMEGKGKHNSAHGMIVWWLTESCGERASERKISSGIILSPPPPTPPPLPPPLSFFLIRMI